MLTFRHSSESVLLTAQCIHVRPFMSRSIPSSSSTLCFSEFVMRSKCALLSMWHAHMAGVRPSLSLGHLLMSDFSNICKQSDMQNLYYYTIIILCELQIKSSWRGQSVLCGGPDTPTWLGSDHPGPLDTCWSLTSVTSAEWYAKPLFITQ